MNVRVGDDVALTHEDAGMIFHRFAGKPVSGAEIPQQRRDDAGTDHYGDANSPYGPARQIETKQHHPCSDNQRYAALDTTYRVFHQHQGVQQSPLPLRLMFPTIPIGRIALT
jgi:hypothetical protein